MKVALLGDIGCFGKFSIENGLNIEESFSEIKNEIFKCDFIVGNLEVPFSIEKKEYTSKSACISSEPENIEVLNYLGITHVNLANNHIGDFGSEGYELTKLLLKTNNIDFFGIEGINSRITFEDNKLALVGYCNMDSNPVYLRGIDDIGTHGINVTEVGEVLDVLNDNHNQGYLNIFSHHSGLEHVYYPSKKDILFARHISEKFSYVYYGHHPHVVQSFELYNKSNLFYSLGNFCFDDVYSSVSNKPLVKMTESNKTGIIPILNIKNNEVIDVQIIYYKMKGGKLVVLDEYESKKIQNILKGLDGYNLDDIELKRKNKLNIKNKNRIKERTLSWYLSRLNYKYFKLFFISMRNRRIYREKFLTQINKIIASK